MNKRAYDLAIAIIVCAVMNVTVQDTLKAQAHGRIRTDLHGDTLPPGALARIGTIRLRHIGSIDSLAFSPGGGVLASAGMDGVRVWNLAQRKEIGHHAPFLGWVRNPVAFTPDGNLLALAQKESVMLLRSPTGEILRQWKHSSSVNSLAIASNGSLLATGGDDGSVALWKLDSGKEALRLTAHNGEVYSVTFSPDSQLLATAGEDQVIRLWDTVSGKEIRKLQGHEGDVNSISFSPDGKTLASASSDATARLWNPSTGNELHRLQGHRFGGIHAVSFAPDSQTVASGGLDGTIRVWSCRTGKEILTIDSYGSEIVQALAVASDGKTIASAGSDGVIRLWDTLSGQEVSCFESPQGRIKEVAFMSDGNSVTLLSAGRVEVWDWMRMKRLQSFGGVRDGPIRCLAVRDGANVIAASRNTVTAWNPALGTQVAVVKQLQPVAHIKAVAITADGRRLAVATTDGTIRVWDVNKATLEKELEGLQTPLSSIESIAFSPNGKSLAGRVFAQAIRLWDLESGKELRRYEGELVGTCNLAFSPDGKFLVSGAKKGLIQWDAATGTDARLIEIDQWTFSVTFSPDGKILATGGSNGIVHLWDMQTRKQIGRIAGPQGVISQLAFSPNGKILATAGQDTTVLLWRVSEFVDGTRRGE